MERAGRASAAPATTGNGADAAAQPAAGGSQQRNRQAAVRPPADLCLSITFRGFLNATTNKSLMCMRTAATGASLQELPSSQIAPAPALWVSCLPLCDVQDQPTGAAVWSDAPQASGRLATMSDIPKLKGRRAEV